MLNSQTSQTITYTTMFGASTITELGPHSERYSPIMNTHEFQMDGAELVMNFCARPEVLTKPTPFTVDNGGVHFNAHKETMAIPGSLHFVIGHLKNNIYIVCERRNIAVVKLAIKPGNTVDYGETKAYYITKRVTPFERTSGSLTEDMITRKFMIYMSSISAFVADKCLSIAVGRFKSEYYVHNGTLLVEPRHFDSHRSRSIVAPKFIHKVRDANGNVHDQIVTSASCMLYSMPRVQEYAFSDNMNRNSRHSDVAMFAFDSALRKLTGKVSGLDTSDNALKPEMPENGFKRFVTIPTCIFTTQDELNKVLTSIRYTYVPPKYNYMNEAIIECDTTEPYFVIVILFNLMMYAVSNHVYMMLGSILQRFIEEYVKIEENPNAPRNSGKLDPTSGYLVTPQYDDDDFADLIAAQSSQN